MNKFWGLQQLDFDGFWEYCILPLSYTGLLLGVATTPVGSCMRCLNHDTVLIYKVQMPKQRVKLKPPHVMHHHTLSTHPYMSHISHQCTTCLSNVSFFNFIAPFGPLNAKVVFGVLAHPRFTPVPQCFGSHPFLSSSSFTPCNDPEAWRHKWDKKSPGKRKQMPGEKWRQTVTWGKRFLLFFLRGGVTPVTAWMCHRPEAVM